jgi:hypothetical protein
MSAFPASSRRSAWVKVVGAVNNLTALAPRTVKFSLQFAPFGLGHISFGSRLPVLQAVLVRFSFPKGPLAGFSDLAEIDDICGHWKKLRNGSVKINCPIQSILSSVTQTRQTSPPHTVTRMRFARTFAGAKFIASVGGDHLLGANNLVELLICDVAAADRLFA